MNKRISTWLACALFAASPLMLMAEQDHGHEHDHEQHQQKHPRHGEKGHDDDDHGRPGHEEDGHDEHDEEPHGDSAEQAGGHGHGGHEEEQSVRLTPQQMQAAGIAAEAVERRPVAEVVRAPGEVKLNAYRTSSVTPRVDAQVVERHARLGDEVTTGQPLVTLSSVDMANAEGELIVAAREWQRVKKLGKKTVGANRASTQMILSSTSNSICLSFR
jgi:biotin carboxyl carrier protein